MTSALDFLLREEGEGSALGFEHAGTDLLSGEEALLDESNYARQGGSGRDSAAAKTPPVDSSDEGISDRRPPHDDASFSHDLIDTYFRHMGNDPWLSREEEVALAKRIEAGRVAILNGLCQIPMLVERIQEWGNALRQSKLRLRDWVDLSLWGDESRFRENNNPVVNVNVEGEPTCTGSDVEEIETIGSRDNNAHSVRLVDREARLTQSILAPDTIDPHAAVEANALEAHIAQALAELTPREQRILHMRFGMGGMEEGSLAEVAKVFGVTRERIRQIKAKAIEKLRHPSLARKLRTFAED